MQGDRPGSYGHYEQDAETLARWGDREIGSLGWNALERERPGTLVVRI